MQEHAGKAEQRTQRDATRLEECRQALWQMKHDVAGEREGELEWGKARSGGCCKKCRCLWPSPGFNAIDGLFQVYDFIFCYSYLDRWLAVSFPFFLSSSLPPCLINGIHSRRAFVTFDYPLPSLFLLRRKYAWVIFRRSCFYFIATVEIPRFLLQLPLKSGSALNR